MSETNDYAESYYKPFTKRTKPKCSVQVLSLYYGGECILKDKPKPFCYAYMNKLKKNPNYKLQKFEIK